MNIAIRYYTRSGNTKNLADAISQAANLLATTQLSLVEISLRCGFDSQSYLLGGIFGGMSFSFGSIVDFFKSLF